MTKFTFLGAAAIFLTMFVSHLSAHADSLDSNACRSSSLAADDNRPAAPSPRWLPSGCETSTRPWSAPVGHRQPQAADIPPITGEEAFAAENARVDRIIRICRDC
jgi:hypothetical protein